MSILYQGRRFAAKFGVHVGRMSRQPATTMMGLKFKPVDMVIDVGANNGHFARDMRRMFPTAHIVSFEPNPEPFSQVDQWARADGNATAVNIAVGEEPGVLSLNIHVDHSPSSSLLKTTDLKHREFPQTVHQAVREVQVKRIDDVLAEIGRPATANSFLKLDIQGFEEKALRGAPKTLAAVGAMMTEVMLDPLYEGQADFHALYMLAREAGLSYRGNFDQFVATNGHVVYLDAFFSR